MKIVLQDRSCIQFTTCDIIHNRHCLDLFPLNVPPLSPIVPILLLSCLCRWPLLYCYSTISTWIKSERNKYSFLSLSTNQSATSEQSHFRWKMKTTYLHRWLAKILERLSDGESCSRSYVQKEGSRRCLTYSKYCTHILKVLMWIFRNSLLPLQWSLNKVKYCNINSVPFCQYFILQ